MFRRAIYFDSTEIRGRDIFVFLGWNGGAFAKGNGSSRRRSSFKVALRRGLEFQVSLNVLRILIRVT